MTPLATEGRGVRGVAAPRTAGGNPHLAPARRRSVPPPRAAAGAVGSQNQDGVDPLRGLPRSTVQSRRGGRCGTDRDQMSSVRRSKLSEASEPEPDRLRSGRQERALWLYTPNINPSPLTSADSPFALDMEDWTSGCTSPSPTIGLWVTSSGKPTLRPLSWPGWKTRRWLRRLYGTISDPSTADRGAAAFISSLPAIPASRSASPESAEGVTIPGTSGRRSQGSSTRSDPNGSSSRTSRATSIWALPTSSENLAAWATEQRRACLRRERWAQATGVAASSSWPTPTAADKGYQPDLIIGDGEVRFRAPFDIDPSSGGQYPLSLSARNWTILWLTLKAMGLDLSTMSRGSSPPVRLTFRAGKGSFADTLICNPAFYERTMGWMKGWTDPELPATGFAVWLQRSRGAFSRLLIANSWELT